MPQQPSEASQTPSPLRPSPPPPPPPPPLPPPPPALPPETDDEPPPLPSPSSRTGRNGRRRRRWPIFRSPPPPQPSSPRSSSPSARRLRQAAAKLGAYITTANRVHCGEPSGIFGTTVPTTNYVDIDTRSLDTTITTDDPTADGAVEFTTTDGGVDLQPSTPPPPLDGQEHRNSSTKNHEKHVQINAVDFVLAYRSRREVGTKDEGHKLDDEIERRRFYRELRAHGIWVNVDDDPTCSLDAGRTCFALLRLSERLLRCRCKCHSQINDNININEEGKSVTNTNDVNHHQQYPNNDEYDRIHNKTFTSAQRAQIVWRIILRIGSNAKHGVMSLNQLLETGIITAAYPVHDGNIKVKDGEDPNSNNDRQVLYEIWARPGLIIPRQWKTDKRINELIRKYYGIPVAVYFCWLRYYTVWLVGPSIAGLVWFLYGLMMTHNDVPTRDICDPKSEVAEWILCPTRPCDVGFCGFIRVLDTCGLYRWASAATFDRPGAVAFAVFMSFWATAFQQLWTSYGWPTGEHRNDDGTVLDSCRPCCVAAIDIYSPDGAESIEKATVTGESLDLSTASKNPRSGCEKKRVIRTPPPPLASTHRSPAYPFDLFRRWYSEQLSISYRAAVFVVTLVAVAAVPVLIVVYRSRAIGWLMSAVFHQVGGQSQSHRSSPTEHQRRRNFFLLNYTSSGELSNWKTAVAGLCAASVQLTAIVAVHRGYSAVAEWLTKRSYRSVYDPRFQSRYTAYMSCFDSANYYSSLIYIAFFKGRFMTRRGEYVDNPSRMWSIWPITWLRSLALHVREDVCDPAAVGTGCVPELCTQMAIIMVGKQLVDNALELTTPLALNVWRRWRAKESRRRNKLNGTLPDTFSETLRHPKQWQLDYQLEDSGPLGLYQEYSEMVIQYGFVVMFATVFPLAPLCALLNNILELRLDAYKMVAAQRRPVPSYHCTNKDLYAGIRTVGHTSFCCNNCIKLIAWTRVLKVLSVISVIYNAFMIAFTSDLLPRYVYSRISSDTSSSSSSPLEGYVAWSLSSERNVTEYYYGQFESTDGPETCRYRGYGADANSEHNDYRHWQVLAARLTFVIIFEHGVLLSITALEYIIHKIVIWYKNYMKKVDFLGDRDTGTEKPNSPIISCIPGAVGTASDVGRQIIISTVSGTNEVANNKTIGENGHPVSTDNPTSSSVVVVDMENDDQDTWMQDAESRRSQLDEVKNSLKNTST